MEIERVEGIAGYRFLEFLVWGKVIYVDDLVTDLSERDMNQGVIIDWDHFQEKVYSL